MLNRFHADDFAPHPGTPHGELQPGMTIRVAMNDRAWVAAMERLVSIKYCPPEFFLAYFLEFHKSRDIRVRHFFEKMVKFLPDCDFTMGEFAFGSGYAARTVNNFDDFYDAFIAPFLGKRTKQTENVFACIKMMESMFTGSGEGELVADARAKYEAIHADKAKRRELRAGGVTQKGLREHGLTQQQIADKVGLTRRRVGQIMEENRVYTPKISQSQKPKRQVIQYKISQYTTPETAAQKIRDKLGDEFAEALKTAL